MGLMLHSKARNLLQEEQFLEALEVLTMAEVCESRDFLTSICSSALAVCCTQDGLDAL